MRYATFYIIDIIIKKNITLKCKNLSAIEILACNLSELLWRKNKRILIYCKNKSQATRLDDALWELPENSFIPHNISEDNLDNITPIKLSWSQYITNTNYNTLINLAQDFNTFVSTFNEVIDFVPYETSLKELARNRYKLYRNIGFQLNIITLSNIYK